MQHNLYTARKNKNQTATTMEFKNTPCCLFALNTLFTNLAPDLKVGRPAWIHQECATSFFRRTQVKALQCCFWSAVVIMSGFDQGCAPHLAGHLWGTLQKCQVLADDRKPHGPFFPWAGWALVSDRVSPVGVGVASAVCLYFYMSVLKPLK